ncbi:hypothetical protein Bca4012_018342 [Brassica carinata]
MSVKELQVLERQLEAALAATLKRKTQVMMEEMEDLRKKERQLGDINKQLKIKVEGHAFKTLQDLWPNKAASVPSDPKNSEFPIQPSSVDCNTEPFLQIGFQQHYYMQGEGSSKSNMACETNFVQGWVL